MMTRVAWAPAACHSGAAAAPGPAATIAPQPRNSALTFLAIDIGNTRLR